MKMRLWAISHNGEVISSLRATSEPDAIRRFQAKGEIAGLAQSFLQNLTANRCD